MTTVTLWLLVNLGYLGNHSALPYSVIERFATVTECERVKQVLDETPDNFGGSRKDWSPQTRCVQATVVKP